MLRLALAVCLLAAWLPAAGAQTATVAYDLHDVWLLPDLSHPGASPQPMTGRFTWTYTPGDFENGTGEFVAADIPWTAFALEDLEATIEPSACELTYPISIHDHGLDLMLAWAVEFSLDAPAPIDPAESNFTIEVGISWKGHVISGSAVPDPATLPWLDHGQALAGAGGAPTLSCLGSLEAGAPLDITLADAASGSTSVLVVGLSAWNAPFKGGVLVPAPDLLAPGLPTGAAGGWTLPLVWPTGVPSGFSTWFQVWVSDASAPVGFSASNAVSGTTP